MLLEASNLQIGRIRSIYKCKICISRLPAVVRHFCLLEADLIQKHLKMVPSRSLMMFLVELLSVDIDNRPYNYSQIFFVLPRLFIQRILWSSSFVDFEQEFASRASKHMKNQNVILRLWRFSSWHRPFCAMLQASSSSRETLPAWGNSRRWWLTLSSPGSKQAMETNWRIEDAQSTLLHLPISHVLL